MKHEKSCYGSAPLIPHPSPIKRNRDNKTVTTIQAKNQNLALELSISSQLSLSAQESNSRTLHRCTQCAFVSKQVISLQNHIKRAHEGLRFRCPVCQKNYTSKHSFTVHVCKTELPHIEYELVTVPDEVILEKVDKEEKPNLTNKVEDPPKGVKNKLKPEKKPKIRIKSKPNSKTRSSKRISTESGDIPKKRKMLSPCKEKVKATIKCEKCEQTFGEKKSLTAHVRSEHSTEGIRYTCPNCPMKWKTKYALFRHACYKKDSTLKWEMIQMTNNQIIQQFDQVKEEVKVDHSLKVKSERTDSDDDLELWEDDKYDELEIWS